MRHLYLCLVLSVIAVPCRSSFWVSDPMLVNWLQANYPSAMNGNGLDETDPSVQATTSLDISYLGIASLLGLEAFGNLTSLNAAGNPITNLAGVPWSVQYLGLYGCQLSGTFQMRSSFISVSIGNNHLTAIDMTWVGQDLNTLVADHNQITTFLPASGGWYTPWLSYLDVSHNQLTAIPGIPNGYVDISYNQITALSVVNGGTQRLNASHNQIAPAIDLTGQGNLVDLDLSYNPLTGGVVGLPSTLRTLNVSNSQLACIGWIPWTLQTMYSTASALSCLPNLPPALNTTPANFGFTPTVCGTASPCYIAPPRIQLKMLLQGPWDEQAQLMRDDLRQQGLLPTTEPYSAMGYPPVGTVVPRSVAASVFATTGPDAIVDWVLVELRSGGTAVLVDRQPALLQRDGDVVSTTGDPVIAFNQPLGGYRVAVRHRNHLGVVTWWEHGLWSGGAPDLVDLRTQGMIGFVGATTVIGGKTILWAGDVDRDRTIKYTGANNDRDPILVAVGGIVPTNVVHGVYRTEDVNMDGDVKYTGANNDRDLILLNIGGTVPTAVRSQVPNF